MIVDEFIEWIKFDDPQEEFSLIVAQNFEMLNAIRAFNREWKVARTRLADADEKCAVVFVWQKFLSVS